MAAHDPRRVKALITGRIRAIHPVGEISADSKILECIIAGKKTGRIPRDKPNPLGQLYPQTIDKFLGRFMRDYLIFIIFFEKKGYMNWSRRPMLSATAFSNNPFASWTNQTI